MSKQKSKYDIMLNDTKKLFNNGVPMRKTFRILADKYNINGSFYGFYTWARKNNLMEVSEKSILNSIS